jgi:hypothetical protein
MATGEMPQVRPERHGASVRQAMVAQEGPRAATRTLLMADAGVLTVKVAVEEKGVG